MKNMNRYVRYGIIYVAASIAMGLVLLFLEKAFGFGGNGGTSVVIPLIMGMQIGQWYFEGSSEQPTPGQKWGDSFRFGALGFVLSLVLAILVLFLISGFEILALVGPTGALILLIVLFALSVLCTRLGIGLGVKGALKSHQKI